MGVHSRFCSRPSAAELKARRISSQTRPEAAFGKMPRPLLRHRIDVEAPLAVGTLATVDGNDFQPECNQRVGPEHKLSHSHCFFFFLFPVDPVSFCRLCRRAAGDTRTWYESVDTSGALSSLSEDRRHRYAVCGWLTLCDFHLRVNRPSCVDKGGGAAGHATIEGRLSGGGFPLSTHPSQRKAKTRNFLLLTSSLLPGRSPSPMAGGRHAA